MDKSVILCLLKGAISTRHNLLDSTSLRFHTLAFSKLIPQNNLFGGYLWDTTCKMKWSHKFKICLNTKSSMKMWNFEWYHTNFFTIIAIIASIAFYLNSSVELDGWCFCDMCLRMEIRGWIATQAETDWNSIIWKEICYFSLLLCFIPWVLVPFQYRSEAFAASKIILDEKLGVR